MIDRISEKDEFLLSRWLDGDLSPDEETGLRERLGREPALRSALASMERLESALADRRADQPEVDWPAFHERVMDAVRAEAAAPSRTIKFPGWARVALPLAAAAAILLMVSIPRPPGDPGVDPIGPNPLLTDTTPPDGVGPPMRPTAKPRERKTTGGTMLVRFNRPSSPAPRTGETVRVTFARSDQLAGVMASADKARLDAPTIVSVQPLAAGRLGYVELSPL